MYFITTLESLDTNDFGITGGSRCVGYFRTFKKAQEAIVNNVADIYEAGTYPYVVLEKVSTGLYQYDMNPIWYEWDEENECYKEIEAPLSMKGFCGFGIG